MRMVGLPLCRCMKLEAILVLEDLRALVLLLGLFFNTKKLTNTNLNTHV